MPTQPPSDRTRAKGGPPVFNPGLSAGDPATTQKKRNEPNFTLAHAPTPPYYAKRTQFAPTATAIIPNKPNLAPLAIPKTRNEPNSRIPSVPPPPNYAKRTQFHPRRTCGRPKNAKRTQSQPGKCAKPTQSPVRARHAVPQIRETNPISHAPRPANRKKNETNPIKPGGCGCDIST